VENGVAEGKKFYLEGNVASSAEYDTKTCCIEVKVSYSLEGGIGAALGKTWKRGGLGLEVGYFYKFKGTLVELKTENSIVLFKMCKHDPPSASFDNTIFDAFFGGHLLGEVGGALTVIPMGYKVAQFGVEGKAEAKAGVHLGIGAKVTADASWSSGMTPGSISVHGNIWVNAKVDSHVIVTAKSKLLISGMWAPGWGNWEKKWVDYDPDAVGLDHKAILKF
jgi:hypothetical protein